MSSPTNPITIKVHHGDEIRRFSIDKLEWNQLMELLHSAYPTPFTLKYDDTDADRVTIINQSDLDDALLCAHNHIVHLYMVDKSSVVEPVATPVTDPVPSTSTPSTATVDTKSDDLSSQLSTDEIKTILTECLSDPSIITTIPGFLMTFIDTLVNNIHTPTPLQTSWNIALSTHPTIRDHVILSVLIPRIQQTLNTADINGMATRIPVQTLTMIKGFLPMLPMFLPSLIPMLTQMMSSGTSDTTNPLSHLMSQTTGNTNNPQGNINPMASNPLLGMLGPMLGPMFQQLQQSPLANMMNNNNPVANNSTTPSTTSSPSTSTSDYSTQLSTLADLGVGSPELNLSLLKQWNGDVEKVVEFLATME